MPDLRDCLRSLGVTWKEHGQSPLVSSGWIGLVCPRCDGGRNKPGLGVHLRTRKTSCWKCGPQGLVSALAAISRRPAAEVRTVLGAAGPVPREPERPRGRLQEPPNVGPLGPAHRRYLKGRGFDPDELAALWGLGGLGIDGGRLAWRLYIPVRDADGRTVSWTTRAIGRVPPGLRYRGASASQSAVPRGEILYGEDLVPGHAVVCVEGPADAWAVGPGAVATAGVGFSRAQMLRLARYPVRVICFDSDRAAQARARDLAAQLSGFGGETYVATVGGKDPAEAPKEDLEELRGYLR